MGLIAARFAQFDHVGRRGAGGILILILLVAVLALVIWLIVRSLRTTAGTSQPARDILSERYARGEIDTDEYQTRLKNLR